MRRRRRHLDVLSSPLLVGAVLIVVGAVGLYVSYNASTGLPFVPKYRVVVEVPDAAELTEGVSEVRIGSSRVGLVREVDAVAPRAAPAARKPYARLTLDLTEDVEPLPADSTVRVRPRSPLGAKYLDLTVGTARRAIAAGGTLPLAQARPGFEFDEAFEAFGPRTRRGLEGSVKSLGDGLAGRGTELNEAIASAARLAPRAERILSGLAAPRTDLGGFLEGAAATTGAIAAVAPQLGSLIERGDVTLGALERSGGALGRYLDELPPTEAVAERTLRHARPVIDDTAAIARSVRAGTALLPAAAARLERAFAAGVPALVELHRARVLPRFGSLARAARAVARDRADPSVAERARRDRLVASADARRAGAGAARVQRRRALGAQPVGDPRRRRAPSRCSTSRSSSTRSRSRSRSRTAARAARSRPSTASRTGCSTTTPTRARTRPSARPATSRTGSGSSSATRRAGRRTRPRRRRRRPACASWRGGRGCYPARRAADEARPAPDRAGPARAGRDRGLLRDRLHRVREERPVHRRVPGRGGVQDLERPARGRAGAGRGRHRRSRREARGRARDDAARDARARRRGAAACTATRSSRSGRGCSSRAASTSSSSPARRARPRSATAARSRSRRPRCRFRSRTS